MGKCNKKYADFLAKKTQIGGNSGFDPVWVPDFLFGFQKELVEWAVLKGRAAIFADCGLGKTPMQLVWAENVVRKTNGRVLILTPLAVAFQTENEAEKFGIEATHRRDGLQEEDRIVIANYERLHYFDSADFDGVVCDESSILKNFDGATRKAITEFMLACKYRLLCTATAAPNDYMELGTSSEALGVMEYKHMLSRFFTHSRDDTSKWRLKGHARTHLFWRWMCSWARAVRQPSDMGFANKGFALPPRVVNRHVVAGSVVEQGHFMPSSAVGLSMQRADLKNTLVQRCEKAASLVNEHTKPAIAWCNLNAEGDLLTSMIDGAQQVAGANTEEHKERVFRGFIDGSVRVLVTKPRIGGFGLNMQHCAHQTYFPSHSYEQYYQSVRRCWRFGQKNEVVVDMITTEGQADVVANLKRKELQASIMFDMLMREMHNELAAPKHVRKQNTTQMPAWAQRSHDVG